MSDYARYSRQIVLREVGVNGHFGAVAEHVSAPMCARPGMAGPAVEAGKRESARDGAFAGAQR
jgi:hypothetical protein